jgi:hypothetical protein
VDGSGVVASIASAIKSHTEAKLESKLEVMGEEKLKTCSVCACHLPLKIWVPIDFLHVTPELETALSEANPNCWQLTKELTPA